MIKVLLYIWQLPQNLIGLSCKVILRPVELIADTGYARVYKTARLLGGVSLGQYAFVSHVQAKNERTIRHEGVGHPRQSRMLGPLYLLVIGIPSMLWAWLGKGGEEYGDFYTESWADRLAGLSDVNKRSVEEEKP